MGNYIKLGRIKPIPIAAALLLLLIAQTTVAKYSGGTGEPNDPYRISTPEDLNDIGNHQEDWNKHFILINDVNLAQYTGTQFKIIGPFSGVFDGNNHKVWNFTWTSTGRNGIGLFTLVGVRGQIKNLGMENINLIAANGSLVGGLVGTNRKGTINNCYSTDSVSGNQDVAGLVGYNLGTIINCYSIGNVSGNDSVGGLVGYNRDGTTMASFWDTQTSSQLTSAGGIGKTTAEMKTMSTFTDAGWDFVEVWGIGENQTYPFLRTEPAGDSNHDKKVDFFDLAILASHWLEGPP